MGQGPVYTLQRLASSSPLPLASPGPLQFHCLPIVSWLIGSKPHNLISSESALTSIPKEVLYSLRRHT